MDSSLRAHIRWFFRALSPARNPLRRGIDRIESVLVGLVVLVALLALPVAGLLGVGLYDQGEQSAQQAAFAVREVPAVLRTDGPATTPNPDGKPDTGIRVPAVWSGADGKPHSGLVAAPLGSKAGTAVPVWVNASDQVTGPPPSHGQVVGSAVIVACGTLLGVEFVSGIVLLSLRAVAIRATSRAWQHEWEIVEPQWRRMQL
jgi:hypothetical protein